METTNEEYLKTVLKKGVREYYTEMVDNAVLSFGDAGNRVMKKIIPLEIRKTVYKSIQRRNENIPQQHERDNVLEGYVELVGPEPIEIGLITRNDILGLRGNTILNIEKPEISIDELIVRYRDSSRYLKKLAKQIFSDIERSASFILVSGFGGSFAQKIHLEFSDLLSSMAIAHLNIVIVPSKTETNKRRLAQKGLRYLKSHDRRVVTFDNDRYLNSKTFTETELIDSLESLNDKIARTVELCSMKISEVADSIKYYLYP